MARMIPDLTTDQLCELPSHAEARFYEECRQQLPGEILVIYSANWLYRDRRGQLREGEADFTVVAPGSGIFAVEIKGGGVSFDPTANRWQSMDRHGVRHDIKDPFRQVSKERHALRDQITGNALWRRWQGTRLTLGHAVMLPDIHDAVPLVGPNRPRPLIGIDDNMRDVPAWLDQVVAFWRNADDDALTQKGVQLVEQILCSPIEVQPAMRSILDNSERMRLRLTVNQAKILRIIGGRKRAIIAGGAGTGKTLIAVEKARQLAQDGRSILLLCYNRPLADALAFSLNNEPSITVLSFHQLCDRRIDAAKVATSRNLLQEAAEAYPGYGNKHLFEVQMPYALALSNELLAEKYDALVVDEAQDFSDDYWFAIEELLHDSAEGTFYIFIDENQALYRKHAQLPVQDEPYHLTSNCRNTAPIHRTGYVFYKGESVDEPDLLGEAVELIAADGDVAEAAAVATPVGRLRHGGLRAEDIVVLLAKRPKEALHNLLQQHRLPHRISWAYLPPARINAVLVETVGRFKGLEAPAVVLWLGDDIVDSKEWELIYVGSTRAKSLLTVVGSPRALATLNK